MRVLGIDIGRRRLGLALSDETAILASPWRTIPAGASPVDSAAAVVAALRVADPLIGEATEVSAVVVGLPKRLNGEDTETTADARALAGALRTLTGLTVHLQDERLTSREAEARLAVLESDWRRRKAKIDAAAAAIILQDFLDARPAVPSPPDEGESC